jgi:predicted cupin superfamily sugar epimerase
LRTADEIIAALALAPHPEGGHYRETWRAPAAGAGARGPGTAIYYLLRAGEESRWHRVDAVEVWHYYTGDPLELRIAQDARVSRLVLGPDVAAGAQPQLIVPKGAWQAARPLGAWTLVGCTVSPAFSFHGFELAPDGWSPEIAPRKP